MTAFKCLESRYKRETNFPTISKALYHSIGLSTLFILICFFKVISLMLQPFVQNSWYPSDSLFFSSDKIIFVFCISNALCLTGTAASDFFHYLINLFFPDFSFFLPRSSCFYDTLQDISNTLSKCSRESRPTFKSSVYQRNNHGE